MLASIAATRAAALATSCSSPMPASRRTVVSRSVSRWLVRLRSATAELLLQAAQLEVVARDFRDDAHAHIVERRFEAFGRRRRGANLRANAAEEVQLPERVEASAIGRERGGSSEKPGIACSRRSTLAPAGTVGKRSRSTSSKNARA